MATFKTVCKPEVLVFNKLSCYMHKFMDTGYNPTE
jgi:hypothetical protein